MKAQIINSMMMFLRVLSQCKNYISLAVILYVTFISIHTIEQVVANQNQLRYLSMLTFTIIAVPLLIAQILKIRALISILVLSLIAIVTKIHYADYLIIDGVIKITDIKAYHSLFNYLWGLIVFISLLGFCIDIYYFINEKNDLFTLNTLHRLIFIKN